MQRSIIFGVAIFTLILIGWRLLETPQSRVIQVSREDTHIVESKNESKNESINEQPRTSAFQATKAPSTEQPVATSLDPNESSVVDQYQFDESKIASMREARLHGDPRTPPIKRMEHTRIKPTEAELADPDLYLEYETRNRLQVYANYVKAAEQKVRFLESFMADAKAKGATESDLAEGYEKIEKLKAMMNKLQSEHQLPKSNLTNADLKSITE